MMIRTLSTLSFIALLAACGGGGGPVVEEADVNVDGPPNTGDADNPAETFDEFGTEEPDEDENDGSELGETLEGSQEPNIELTGIAFVRDPRQGRSTVELRDGEFTEANGTRTLDGQLIALTGDVPGTFTQTSSFVQDSEGAVGIIGIATDLSAMPDSGSATFNGGATGLVIVGDSGFELRDGDSTIVVDFQSGRLRADLGNFTSVSTVSGKLDEAPFETIALDQALISGTSFSGGTITTGGGDTIEQVVGANATALSQGQFYGTNVDEDAPTEVGGILFVEGDEGLIYGSFIGAD